MTNAHVFVVRHQIMHAVRCSALGLLTLALAGCETASSIFGTAASGPAQVASVPTKSKLAFGSIVGAPAQVSSMLTSSIVTAVAKQSIPVAQAPGEAADYTVLGYMAASPDKAGTKLTYIWDVKDKAGQRAHRITGEELVPGKPGKDPWKVVDQAVVDRITANTSAQLAAWVPMSQPVLTSQAPATTGTAAPAALGSAQPAAEPAALTTPKAGNLVSGQVVNPAPQPQQAALPPGQFAALVPAVVGAPGDGPTSLTQAIQKHLSSNGVPLTQQPGPGAYVVQGRVEMGQPASGKQAIKIEWQVFDPAGKKVGTVSQNNSVPQGALDGPWGRTADAAAAAAAQGIIKLLPPRTKVN